MKDQQYKPEDNKGASPVSPVANGNAGDHRVLDDKTSKTTEGKNDQHQHADRGMQNGGNDEEDQFDLNSLKGNASGGGQHDHKPKTNRDADAS